MTTSRRAVFGGGVSPLRCERGAPASTWSSGVHVGACCVYRPRLIRPRRTSRSDAADDHHEFRATGDYRPLAARAELNRQETRTRACALALRLVVRAVPCRGEAGERETKGEMWERRRFLLSAKTRRWGALPIAVRYVPWTTGLAQLSQLEPAGLRLKSQRRRGERSKRRLGANEPALEAQQSGEVEVVCDL